MQSKIIPLCDKLPKKEDIVTSYIAHTYHKPSYKGSDEYLLIKEILLDKNNNHYPIFKLIVNPDVTYYLTKPKYRTYVVKKEAELISRLDCYRCEHRYLYYHIKRNLHIKDKRYHSKVLDYPYVYGADIDVSSKYKLPYIDKNENQTPYNPVCAYLDIEKDVDTNQINVMSITLNHNCYSFINKEYMVKYDQSGNKHPVSFDQIKSTVNNQIGQLLSEYKYTISYNVCDNEKHLLIELFKFLHSHTEIDFIGIWNLNYDVPEIALSLERNGLSCDMMFSSPKVPDFLKYYNYQEDGVRRDHYILKWHWVYAPASFQWIDAMTLYGWNRRTQPYEDNYKIDTIMNKTIKSGKLFVIDDHREFQRYRFDEYCAYNAVDTIRFDLMESKLKDLNRMYTISSYFDIKDYGFSAIRLRNRYYHFYKKIGYITASSSKSGIKNEFDNLIPKTGGAVLSPQNSVFLGINNIAENPFIKTMINLNCADFDFTSIYPSIMVALGTSRDTMVYGATEIEKFNQREINNFFAYLASLNENAVHMGNRYFNLPNYTEIVDLVKNQLNGV